MNTRILIVLAAGLLAACSIPGGASGPVRQFSKGDELAYYTFSEPNSFEEGAYSDGAVRLEIRNGAYHIDLSSGDSELWYGQWGGTLSDTVIDVEISQTTESTNTVYGVMCRARGTVGQVGAQPDPALESLAVESAGSGEMLAQVVAAAEATAEATEAAPAEATAEATVEATAEATLESRADATVEPAIEEGASSSLTDLNVNNGDGYLFLIEGNGRFAIMKARGRSLTPLVDWTSSDKINQGPARNSLRAVCMGNYLALYINGEFMADASDDTYNRGQVALVAAAASRLGNQVAFDNLSISEARPG